MTDEEHVARTRSPRPGPEVVAPPNRVTVAFPFSKIVIQAPSDDLAELAAVVAELAALLDRITPDPGIKTLRERARTLAVGAGRS